VQKGAASNKARLGGDRRLAGGIAWFALAVSALLLVSPALALAPDGEPSATVAPAAGPSETPLPGNPDLRARLAGPAVLTIAGERLHADLLRHYYAAHAYQTVWDTRQPQATALWNLVLQAGTHGLDPNEFHAGVLAKQASLSLVDRDLLLSDAFLGYADALTRGAMTIDQRPDEEDLVPETVDVVAALDAAVAAPDPAAAIEALAPATPAYAALRRAYAVYRATAQAGGWPHISDPENVALLQARLAAEGYLPAGYHSAADDDATKRALKGFQEHHGLDADGVVGPATLAELNVSAEARAHQLAVALERLRWLPRALPADRLWVDAANERLQLFRDNQPVFTTRVVVGDDGKQTPEFHASVVSVLYNPPWNIPTTIAETEILPKLAEEPDYLDKHHMTLRSNGSVHQEPGTWNALGQLKFEMPNRYDVYLHDTPQKALFARFNRRMSHGCVRVENPRALASLLLNQPVDAINKGIALGTTNRHYLPAPLPVFIVYQTVSVDADGSLQFRRDFYERDDEVWQHLTRSPQPPVAQDSAASQRGG
jgi:murein L,D-transpeptidase YcbB/YkuD